MESKVFLLDNNLNFIKEVDDYISLIWCERFIEFGAVDLELPLTKENFEMFQNGYFLIRGDMSNKYHNVSPVFIINNKEVSTAENKDDTLVIGAIDLRVITEHVPIIGKLDSTIEIKVADWIYETFGYIFIKDFVPIVASNAPINKNGYEGFLFDKISESNYYVWSQPTKYLLDKEDEKLSEHIFHLLQNGNIGWRIHYSYGNLFFALYPGVDHSLSQNENDRIIFSDDFENLQMTKHVESTDDYANIAIVKHNYNDTFGNSFFSVYNEDVEPKGINRVAIIVDGTNIVLESTKSDDVVTFMEKIKALAFEELEKHKKKSTFECEVFSNVYEYRNDYKLGDIVTVKTKYGITIDCRIIEVIETWDDSGYTVEPVFEKIDRIEVENALLTESKDYLTSEAGEYILYEEG
jgi:hypothetical protein